MIRHIKDIMKHGAGRPMMRRRVDSTCRNSVYHRITVMTSDSADIKLKHNAGAAHQLWNMKPD